MARLFKKRNERSDPLISTSIEPAAFIEVPAQEVQFGFLQARMSTPETSFMDGAKNFRQRRNLNLHSYNAAAHHKLYNVGLSNDHHSHYSVSGEPIFDIKRDEPGARRNSGHALLFRPTLAGSVELVCLVNQLKRPR